MRYEITVELPASLDWAWYRETYADFHTACECGLAYAATRGGRLIRVEPLRQAGIEPAGFPVSAPEAAP